MENYTIKLCWRIAEMKLFKDEITLKLSGSAF